VLGSVLRCGSVSSPSREIASRRERRAAPHRPIENDVDLYLDSEA